MTGRRWAFVVGAAIGSPLLGVLLAVLRALEGAGTASVGQAGLPVAYAVALAPPAAVFGAAGAWLLGRARGGSVRGATLLGAVLAVGGLLIGVFLSVAVRGWHAGAGGWPPPAVTFRSDELAMATSLLAPAALLGAAAASAVRSRGAVAMAGAGLAVGVVAALGAGPLLLASRALSGGFRLPPLGVALVLVALIAVVARPRS